jgi:hypothetical protein
MDAERVDHMLDTAWTIIANAHGGNWNDASAEWRAAAERWREAYHEWLDSPTGNAADRVAHGTNGVKLTASDVQGIREALTSGSTCNELAERYGITPGAVRHIRHGHTWKRLPIR